MQAGGSQPDDGVAWANLTPVDNLRSIYDPDGEARKVILTVRVEGWHFRGLAADQRASGLPTAFRNAFDDRFRLGGGQFSSRQVVQKKAWLCPTVPDVVHAHRDQIDAHRVVLVHQKRNLELRPDPIGP